MQKNIPKCSIFLSFPGKTMSESTIVFEGFKGGTRSSPIMPRDVSLSDSKCPPLNPSETIVL